MVSEEMLVKEFQDGRHYSGDLGYPANGTCFVIWQCSPNYQASHIVLAQIDYGMVLEEISKNKFKDITTGGRHSTDNRPAAERRL